MRKIVFALCIVISPVVAWADGLPTFVSGIPGVQLWDLKINEAGFPEERFDPEAPNEFIAYCDGAHSLYINSNPAPYPCQADGKGRIFITRPDKSLAGLAIVSMHPVPGRSKLLPLTNVEIAAFAKIENRLRDVYAQTARQEYKAEYPNFDDASYTKMMNAIRSEPAFAYRRGVRYKFAVKNDFIYITPVGIVPNVLGWNLIYAVFRKQKSVITQIGDIRGCIEGYRNLDASGEPNVLTRLCESSQGSVDAYWSLSPDVHVLLGRVQ